jgi:ABC-2 type transport system permease protein
MKNNIALEIRSVRNIFLRDILRFFRDSARVIGSVVQPIFFLGVFGVGLKSTLGMGQGIGFDFVQFMFPGIIATTTLGVALNTSISIVTDREFGFLKEILVAPVSRASIMAGKILSGIVIGLFQAILLIALSPLFGLTIDWSHVPGLLFVALLLSFAVTSMGLFIATRMRNAEGFQFVFQFLFFPMMFLSGAFFPLTNVPTWMKIVSNINPLTYAVDGLRNVVFHNIPDALRQTIILHSLPFDCMIIVGFGLVMFGLAFWSFNRAE